MDTRPSSSSQRRSRSSQRSMSSSSMRRPSLKRSSSLSSSKKIEFSGAEYNEEIPTLKVMLDNTLPLDYFKQDLISILQTMKIPKWCKLNINDQKNLNDVNIDRISGALTNSIYKISYKKYYPILLRIYGTNAESIIDREKELETLAKLSRKNIGPKLLGFFTNGRFEQFLHNSITLTAKQIRDPKISRIIARRMKELHRGISLETEDKIDGPRCWSTIEKWLGILKIFSKDLSEEQQIEIFSIRFKDLESVVMKYKKKLYLRYNNGLNFFNEMVFCHNDTQYGNLLFYNPEEDDLLDEIVSTTDSLSLENESSNNLTTINKDTTKFDKKLVVIDFEYSGGNVPLYDIANHFCEWMYDYNDPSTSYISDTTKYPSRDQRLNFIKSYYKYDEENSKHIEDNIRKLYNDCILWRPANCLFWALWAIVKERESHEIPTGAILEVGPNGEKYLIKESDDENNNTSNVIIEEENAFGSKNSDDEFDYIKYAGQKLSIFFADLIQLDILDPNDFSISDLKKLDCEFI